MLSNCNDCPSVDIIREYLINLLKSLIIKIIVLLNIGSGYKQTDQNCILII